MRMIMFASIPTDVFNAFVKDGTAGAKIHKILEQQKPESVYFTDLGGMRTAVMAVDLASTSAIPALAEPWFLTFQAEVEIHPAMTPADLGASGLDKIAKEWG